MIATACETPPVGGTLVDAFAQNDPLVLFTRTDQVDGLVNPGVVTVRATMRQIELTSNVRQA